MAAARLSSTLRAILAVAAALAFASPASAAITSSFSNGVLTLSSDAADSIYVYCLTGNVQVDGQDPDTGPVACNSIRSVDATAGPGGSSIDLSSMDPVDFPALTSALLTGGPGNDGLAGPSAAPAVIDGGPGDDSLSGYGGGDTLSGGTGDDLYGLQTVVNGTEMITDSGGTDELIVDGTFGDDLFTLSGHTVVSGATTIVYSGIDSISLSGMEGDDTFRIEPLDPLSGPISIDGWDGNDTFVVDAAPNGRLNLDGQDGSDSYVVKFSAPSAVMAVSDTGASGFDSIAFDCTGLITGPEYATNGSQQLRWSGMEQAPTCPAPVPAPAPPPSPPAPPVTAPSPPAQTACSFKPATAGPDRVTGTACNDTIDAGKGNDVVTAGAGNDTVYGGPGNDRLYGGPGADMLYGGAGNDFLSGGPGRDRLFGGPGDDRIDSRDGERDVVDCGVGVDTVRADRFDVVRHCEHVSRA